MKIKKQTKNRHAEREAKIIVNDIQMEYGIEMLKDFDVLNEEDFVECLIMEDDD